MREGGEEVAQGQPARPSLEGPFEGGGHTLLGLCAITARQLATSRIRRTRQRLPRVLVMRKKAARRTSLRVF
jgi:hypothetical protein